MSEKPEYIFNKLSESKVLKAFKLALKERNGKPLPSWAKELKRNLRHGGPTDPAYFKKKYPDNWD